MISHISIAKRYQREGLGGKLGRALAVAVAHDRAWPDPDQAGVDRLLLARGSIRQDVLNQYREAQL